MLRKNILFIVFVILSFVFKHDLLAFDYFSENFDSGVSWKLIDQTPGSKWYTKDGRLYSDAMKGGSSIYEIPVDNIGDFIMEISIENQGGVDMPLLLHYNESLSSYYLLGIRYADSNWSHDDNQIVLWKFSNGTFSLLKSLKPDQVIPNFVLSKEVERRLKVIFSTNRIKVFLDDVEFIDYTDVDPIKFGKVGLYSWGGDYNFGFTRNVYDKVKLYENTKKKVFILPGLGASWNNDALVYNKAVDPGSWSMTPFVDNYDSLIDLLNVNNLKKNEDYWVWNYDWRKPIVDISEQFNSFVATKMSPNDDVFVVGHSLGGLVGRTWLQNNGGNAKLITLGSPHHGSVDAYEAWEGGVVGSGPNISNVAMNILVTLQSKYDETRVNTVRRIAPVLKDLMPTESFIKINNRVVGWDSLIHKNIFLKDKNSSLNNLFDNNRLSVVASPKFSTKNWIIAQPPTIFDQKLGYWTDGKPFSYQYSDGDGLVTLSSAKFEGKSYETVNALHEDMPKASIGYISEVLGLGETVSGAHKNTKLIDKIILFVGSPAYIKSVCNGIEDRSDGLGFLIIDKASFDTCEIELVGIEDGKYHLVAGLPGVGESWIYDEGDIKKNEIVKVDFILKKDELSFGLDEKWSNIKTLLPLLTKWYMPKDIDVLLKDCQEKKTQTLINNLFVMRKKYNEYELSNRVLRELFEIYSIENEGINRKEAEIYSRRMLQQKSLLDAMARINLSKGLKPSVKSSVSYSLIESYWSSVDSWMKSFSYGKIKSASLLVDKYLKEIW